MPPTRHILALTLLFIITTPALAQTTQPQEPTPATLFPQDMAKLKSAIQTNDSAAALQTVNNLVANHPKEPLAYLVRAEVHAQLRDFDASKADLLKALALTPGHVPATLMLANLQIKTRLHQAALETLDKSLALNPKNTALLTAKADLQAALNMPAEADNTYRLAIASTSDPLLLKTLNAKAAPTYETLFARARQREATGDLANALADYKLGRDKLLTLHPSTSPDRFDKFIKPLEATLKERTELSLAQTQKTALELKTLQDARAKLLALALAFQKSSADQSAIDALIQEVAVVAPTLDNAKDASLIPLHASELNPNAPDAIPPDIAALRAKANALSQSLNIPLNIEATDPDKARALFDQVLAIYPDPWLLLRRSFIHYQKGDLKAALQDAALACAIDSLHKFQHPTGALSFFKPLTPEVQGRRLFMQLDRLRSANPSAPEKELLLFTRAVEKQDWVQAQQTHRANRSQWASTFHPLGFFIDKRDHASKVFPNVQTLYAAQLTQKDIDDKTLRQFAEEAAAQPLTNPDALDALLAAWTKLGAAQDLQKSIDDTLLVDKYNPSARIAQGKAAEAQNRPIDAMLLYNIATRGNPIKDLTGRAVDAADARDRIEAKLTTKVALQAYSDYLAKELDDAHPGSPRLPALECAITRFLPYAQHPFDMLFYRGELYFHMKDYPRCIADMRALIGKQDDLQSSLWAYIGDASKNLAADAQDKLPLYTQAVDAYSKSIPLADPAKPMALGLIHYARGNCYQALAKPDLAAPDFLKTIQLLSDEKQQKVWAYHELAKAQFDLGQKDQALENANKAIALSKHFYPQVPGVIAGFAARLQSQSK